MKPLIVLVCVLLLSLLSGPFTVAVLLNAVIGPAVQEQLRIDPCSASTTTVTMVNLPDDQGEEGGVGFPLPPAQQPRKASLTNPPLPIPPAIQVLYQQAANVYQLPWTLLAGIGMEETGHGRTNATSSAGARGLMQFMPATFAGYGVDGDGDGQATITNDADSIHSAANYLTRMGVTQGEQGIRDALFAYNRATWYVNDVLAYAHAYGGGIVLGDPTDCGLVGNTGNPTLPPLTDQRVAAMFSFARQQVGDRYILGANGPDAWDCSSFTQATLASIGVTIPRTARSQRDWLAKGNGFRVQPGQERPGDFVFTNTWLGPNVVGHVMLVYQPASHTSIEAQRKGVGFYDYTVWKNRNIYEIWRLGNLADTPTTT